MDTQSKKQVYHLGDMLRMEAEVIKKRRRAKGFPEDLEVDSLALALSGGGIRSATVCLGIVEQLNRLKIFERCDYLSTVSGGGYLGAYIHTALNDENPLAYQELFNPKDIAHIRSYREYLYWLPNGTIGRFISKINLLSVALASTLMNFLWVLIPIVFLIFVNYQIEPANEEWWFWGLVALVGAGIIGSLISPNYSSPHRYYKRRLSRAYLFKNRHLKLTQLQNPLAPYPLINATVHVNRDKYDQGQSKHSESTVKTNYRGQIKNNYFLFSPEFCGSQVTWYTKTNRFHYKNKTLATAMATSAAAVNTFMGNQKLPILLRNLLSICNLRTGILAPNPQLKFWQPAFWPYYTLLEILGKPNTTTNRIQVSDGGHIENLAVYELLRRKVKVIIAMDAGQDGEFQFEDLRNLVIRANSELGINFHFHPKAMPENVIRSSASSGFSNRSFVVARLSALPNAYAEPYDGIFIYVKSSVRINTSFDLRDMKNELEDMVNPTKDPAIEQKINEKRRALDSWMYKTYNPEFPHESTADQFFDEAQWDAYHLLGQRIGKELAEALQLEDNDGGAQIFAKALDYYKSY